MTELDLTKLDHQDIKQNLIDFLSSTGKFGDFDFEGSGINTLVDLLVRNNMYDSYLAHMMANESFIQTAQVRGNVSSQAQKLSYLPRSTNCSKAKVDLTVVPEVTTSLPSSIVAPKGTKFVSMYDGETYTFTTMQPYTLALNGSNQYVVNDVELFQGTLTVTRSTHLKGDKIYIPNNLADIDTLNVVADSSGSVTPYTRASSIKDIVNNSNLYFISEDSSGKYYIEFGKDRLGNEPTDSSVVTLEYIVCEDNFANGANSFSLISTIEGYSNAIVNVSEKASGGQDKESIEEIRFNAPRAYEAQERSLSISDYSLLLKKSGYAIKSSKFWSGNGRVYYSAILKNDEIITRSIEENINSFFEDYYVGSVDLKFVEPKKISIELENKIKVDYSSTNKTFNQIWADVQSIINNYNEKELNNFSGYFNDSELTARAKSIQGLEYIEIYPKILIDIEVNRSNGAFYRIDFNNPIKSGSVIMENFIVNSNATEHMLYDVDGEILLEYIENNVSVNKQVGSVDYQQGVVQFSMNMIQDAPVIEIEAKPENENIYANNNFYIDIVGSTVEEV